MTESLTQKASLITDGVNNYSIQNGVWIDVGAIPTSYSAKVTFFEDNGFRVLNKTQLSQLKTTLLGGKGKFLTMAHVDLADFFSDGSGEVLVAFDGRPEDMEHITKGTPNIQEANGRTGVKFSGVAGEILEVSLPEDILKEPSTVSFFMHSLISSPAGVVSNNGNAVYGGFEIAIGSGGYLSANLSNRGQPVLPTAVSTFNNLLHVAVTFTPDGYTVIYINGIESLRVQETYLNPADVLHIGGTPYGGGYPFIGSIYRLRVLNRSISASEAMELATEVI